MPWRRCRRLVVPTDVGVADEVERLATAAAEFGHGRIDVWINNAGIGAVGAFDETPLEAHEQVVQTDLLGYLRGAHAVLPYFKQQSAGVLINTLSVGSWVAQPYAVAYSASKFGLRGLTQALRGELVQWPGIHVCDIYPGVVDTPGFRDGGNYTGRAWCRRRRATIRGVSPKPWFGAPCTHVTPRRWGPLPACCGSLMR